MGPPTYLENLLSPAVSLPFAAGLLQKLPAGAHCVCIRRLSEELAGEPIEVLPSPLRVPTAFLLVTLGLRAREDIQGAKLFCTVFPTHNALCRVSAIRPVLRIPFSSYPILSMWKEWDRCKKLRRAAATISAALEALLHAAETPEHVHRPQNLQGPCERG